MAWLIFDGHYEKTMYDIRLDNGEIIENCWPNAGLFHCIDTGGEYDSERVAMIKIKVIEF